jgi:hypothetical protein
MDSEQQDICEIASINAQSLEKILLTYDDVINLSAEETENVISRCQQIITCMKMLQQNK